MVVEQDPTMPVQHLLRWLSELDDAMKRHFVLRVLRATAVGMWNSNASTLACAMAFQFFLGLLPMLGLATWLATYVALGDSDLLSVFSAILDLAPDATRELLERHRNDFSSATAPLVILGALWLASGAFAGMITAFEESARGAARSWLRRRAVAIGCALGLLVAVLFGASLSLWLSGAPDWFRDNLNTEIIAPRWLGNTLGALLTLLLCTLLLAAFFRVGIRSNYSLRHTLPGSVVTVLISSVVSWGFAVYARTLSQYALYYGSLAAVIVVLVWLWLCSLALLVGVELNTQLEAFSHGHEDGHSRDRFSSPNGNAANEQRGAAS